MIAVTNDNNNKGWYDHSTNPPNNATSPAQLPTITHAK